MPLVGIAVHTRLRSKAPFHYHRRLCAATLNLFGDGAVGARPQKWSALCSATKSQNITSAAVVTSVSGALAFALKNVVLRA